MQPVCLPNKTNEESARHDIGTANTLFLIRWMMTSQVITNPKGDKEMLFSPDLPDEHFNRYTLDLWLVFVSNDML